MVHAGPFANIAHGNSSIVADQISLKLVGEVPIEYYHTYLTIVTSTRYLIGWLLHYGSWVWS